MRSVFSVKSPDGALTAESHPLRSFHDAASDPLTVPEAAFVNWGVLGRVLERAARRTARDPSAYRVSSNRLSASTPVELHLEESDDCLDVLNRGPVVDRKEPLPKRPNGED